MNLDFDKYQDGLVPTIIQNAETRDVLMLGYTSEASLEMTRQSGIVTFYSRSRQQLWTKGETSGNTLAVEELREDCDGDAILLRVRPAGPACHTGSMSCFAPWLWRLDYWFKSLDTDGTRARDCRTDHHQ